MSVIPYTIVACVWFVWACYVYKLFARKITFEDFFVVTVFMSPFYSVSFGLFGFQLSIYKFIPLIPFLYTSIIYKSIRIPVVIIGIYFSLVALLHFDIALYYNLFDEAVARGRELAGIFTRLVVQHILFVLSILQIWTISLNEMIDSKVIFRSYVVGCLALVIVGYLQLAIFHFGGPWFEFWWIIDALGRTAENGMASHAFDSGFFRMSSLGGEPRHFASFLSVAVLIVLYLRDTVNRPFFPITGITGVVSIVFLCSGIIFSVSSSGLGVLVLGVTAYLLATRRFSLVILALFLLIALFMQGIPIINNILLKLKSADMILYAAPKDAFTLRVLFDSVTGLFIGYGTNLAEFFYPQIYLASNPLASLESTVSPTSPLLQIIVNGGIVGFLLLCWYVYKDSALLDKMGFAFLCGIIAAGIMGSSLILVLGFFFISVLLADGRTRFAANCCKYS